MPQQTLTINGRTYSVRRTIVADGRYVHVNGPMEHKRPHHGMYDTEQERWLSHSGLAGAEGHSGARVKRFYADANEAVDFVRAD